MADLNCRTCFDQGIIFDKNDLAIPCPMCDQWMEPEGSSVIRSAEPAKSKGKNKKKTPKKPVKTDIDITRDDMGDFFDDLYDLSDDDPSTWGAWWDDDDAGYDFDTPLRPVKDNGGQKSQKGRNPRPIQNFREPSKIQWKPQPRLRAHEYVKDVPERENPDDFEYDTRWFNEDHNQHILQTVRKLTDAYPVTKNWFRGIRVSDVPPTACVVPNDRAIWLTPSFLDKPGQAPFKRNFKPDDDDEEGFGKLDRLIAHEFGHVLHASILADSVGKHALPDLDMNDLLGRNYKSDSLSHPDSPATYIMEEGKKKVNNTFITGYGETDELERFAEAMTEHWTNPRPPELASYVGQNIDFLYHKNKGLEKANDYTSWWDTTMEKKDSDDDYKKFWSDVTGQDYENFWVKEKRKQQTEKADRAQYQRMWEDNSFEDESNGEEKRAHTTPVNKNVQEFLHPKDEERSYEGQQYMKWWEKMTREQYEAWWKSRQEAENSVTPVKAKKTSSVIPDVLYHVAPMKQRDELIDEGFNSIFAYSNETDAKVAAHEQSEVEPQDIWYIDPEGLNISSQDDGWKVQSHVTIDNVMQIEGWDPEKNGHPLQTTAAHEDDHEADYKHAGRIGEVDYYIASCKCGWKSNIRSETAARNAWQRHSDSLNEEQRRELAGPRRRSFGSNWKSIRVDGDSEHMIGYGYDKQGSTQHAQAARPRQREEALIEVLLRAPEVRISKEHSSVRNTQEVLRKRAQEAEGTIEDRFHPADRVFLDADDNWPVVDDVADAAQIVAPEAGAVRDAGEIDGALGSARSAYMYGAHSDIFDTVADVINNIQSRQAITNGNKRAATLIGRTMLENAGYDTSGWDTAPDLDCPICYGTGAITQEGRAGMALGTPCDWCVEPEVGPTGRVHPVARLVYGLSDAPDDVTHDQSEFADFMRQWSKRREQR